ncbi:unnamed protein product [Gongylonema pulchrum]|uniref:Uncharacterized protein n=1 Tax=Gongylonema pulchrum TaxID=637853 RepID=A0A183E178_9BILA|nr:unnamed protein product [Gongylonema pulchrum]
MLQFGAWLNSKERLQQKWLHDSDAWPHAFGKLDEATAWMFSKLSCIKFTRSFELTGQVSDDGGLVFTFYIKRIALSNEIIYFNMREAVDVKSIFAIFFPELVPYKGPAQGKEARKTENVEGFLNSLPHETLVNWEICTNDIVAVLRPYQKWLHDSDAWPHAFGKLDETTAWMFSKLSCIKSTRSFELTGQASDDGGLVFTFYVKRIALSNEVIYFNMREAVDVKSIFAIFFPELVPYKGPAQGKEARKTENVEGFLNSLPHETPVNWEICTTDIVAVLRPYQLLLVQEDAVRFMISREDISRPATVNIENEFIILPTIPKILYSPTCGAMSLCLEKPSYSIPPGL